MSVHPLTLSKEYAQRISAPLASAFYVIALEIHPLGINVPSPREVLDITLNESVLEALLPHWTDEILSVQNLIAVYGKEGLINALLESNNLGFTF